jgi:L-ascorbate metabolism protein UlaG (beta-lactamase superfamily)
MIQPVLKDDDFIADVLAARDYTDEVHIWWLGQSGFLVQWQNHHLLLDPYLSDSLTHKYAGTDKPHVRMTELVVHPERLNFIDVVTSSHNHTDHLDKETLVPLMRVNPKIQLVVPEANRGFVADRLGIMIETPRGIEAGKSKRFGVFEIEAVPAAHPDLERDEWGNHKFLGYIVKCGDLKIYHSGDTLRYEGIEAKLSCYQPDIALLPINGDRPERRVAGNLNAHEAAALAKSIGARVAIPCHYEMFEFNTASPDDFISACATVGQPCRILRAGERWSSSELDVVAH